VSEEQCAGSLLLPLLPPMKPHILLLHTCSSPRHTNGSQGSCRTSYYISYLTIPIPTDGVHICVGLNSLFLFLISGSQLSIHVLFEKIFLCSLSYGGDLDQYDKDVRCTRFKKKKKKKITMKI
jgi:hypothetical protein